MKYYQPNGSPFRYFSVYLSIYTNMFMSVHLMRISPDSHRQLWTSGTQWDPGEGIKHFFILPIKSPISSYTSPQMGVFLFLFYFYFCGLICIKYFQHCSYRLHPRPHIHTHQIPAWESYFRTEVLGRPGGNPRSFRSSGWHIYKTNKFLPYYTDHLS